MAAKYIANATGENVTISQVIDWGAQGFYGLYLLTNSAFKYENEAEVFEKDILVKFHPNAEQSTTLQSGYSICIESGLLEGRKVIFILSKSSRLYNKNRTNEHSVDFNYSNIALIGAELANFTAGIANPQKTVKPADAPAAKLEAGADSSPSDEIPGKMPRTAIGKLAIKAAWEIECKTSKLATANQVIAKLVEWIETEPILLEKIQHGIQWMTTNITEADFSIEACGKTLAKWNLTRR